MGGAAGGLVSNLPGIDKLPPAARGAIVGAVNGGVTAFATGALNKVTGASDQSWGEIAVGTLGCAAVGAATGAITGAIAGAIANRQQAKAQAAAAAADSTTSSSSGTSSPPAKRGSTGEGHLAELVGGESQVRMTTVDGQVRVVDQYANGIANESKEGYTAATQFVQKQIGKDVQLIDEGQISGSVWHFFTSPTTGKSGPSQPLADLLTGNGIPYIIYEK